MTFLTLCKCLALLALAAALASIPLNIGTPRYVVDRLTDDLTVAIKDEGAATRAAALIAISESRADVLARVDRLTDVAQHELQATRLEASAHIIGLADVADRRLAAIQQDANAHGLIIEQLAAHELGRAVDSWDQISTEATATLAESRRTVHDLHPQMLGLVAAAKVAAGELATSGREWQRAAPVFIESGKSIAGNVDALTVSAANIGKNIERLTKPHWYDRLLGYGVNGAVLYRNLNPVTNLTVKSAQILAGRP